MNYEAAMAALAEGKLVRRAAWEDPPIYLVMGRDIKGSEPGDYPEDQVISVEPADYAYYFPWQPSEADKTAADWELTKWHES